jgi:soluble P-type ATPase
MIGLTIPGFGELSLSHLVLDYNGTLAVDGKLLPGAREVLVTAAKDLQIHIATADTFGLAASQLAGLPIELTILDPESQTDAKAELVNHLGAATTAAIGSGRADRKMLAAAALSIAVISKEGTARETLENSHLVTNTIWDALELLRHPNRLLSTLRS